MNLVNFMDGIDLMTVAEVVPMPARSFCSAGSASFRLDDPRRRGAVWRDARIRALQPAGGEDLSRRCRQPSDRPAGGWCLLQLAWHQQFAAALLLPLYFLADATVTLLRRMARREPFWAAHRTHFYQRATDNGFSVWRVVSEVFVLNIVLTALAIGSVMTSSAVIKSLLLAVGGIADSGFDVPLLAQATAFG